METVKKYQNENLTVIWKPQKCIHSGVCVKTLPRVYDPKSKVSFVGKIGPQLSFLTTSKLTDGNDNDVISDTDDRFEDVGFGGVVIAGAQIRLSSRLFLEPSVWFDNEFTNAESENFTSIPVRRESRHNMTTGLQLQLIYRLDKR